MTSGSRDYSRSIVGAVSSPGNLYTLAQQVLGFAAQLLPDAKPQGGMLQLDGIGTIHGPDLLDQLTDDERNLRPVMMYLSLTGSGLTITFMYRIIPGPVGYSVGVSGSDEVQVIGFTEKLRPTVERLTTRIEAGESLPPAPPFRSAGPMRGPAQGPQSPAFATVAEPTAAPKVAAPPSIADAARSTASNHSGSDPRKRMSVQPAASTSPERSRVKAFFMHQYTIAILAGLAIWFLTNLPSVAATLASWWSAVAAQPWLQQVLSIFLSMAAGVALTSAWTWLRRRRRAT